MDSVYLYDRWYGHIPSAGWDEVTSRTERVCDHWDQPDEGIGETRGGPGKFLYSWLMCWVAIERAIRLTTRRGLPADLERWRRRRRRGRSANAAGQVTLSGYPPWTHSPPAWCPIRRSTGTTRGPARTGCAARLAFEKMLTYANHLGLYAGQISRTGQQQGNFPRR